MINKDGGDGLSNAAVNGHWEFVSGGGTSSFGTASGVTDAGGVVSLQSAKRRAGSGDIFRFVVDTVVRPYSTFEPSGSLSGEGGVP